MYHPLPRQWLLATNKIEIVFSDSRKTMRAHGSGFWVRDNDKEVVFVTNRHLIDLEYKDQKYIQSGFYIEAMRIVTFDTHAHMGNQEVVRTTIVKHHDSGIDLVLLRDIKVPRKEVFTIEPANMDVIATDSFISSELEWGAMVSFTSFQHWRDSVTERPILRSGLIASDPKHPYTLKNKNLNEIFLLEAMSFEGSSGSPVFANAQGIKVEKPLSGGSFRPAKLVGVMTGHLLNDESVTRHHTGLSYCHKSDLLLDMLSKKSVLDKVCWENKKFNATS